MRALWSQSLPKSFAIVGAVVFLAAAALTTYVHVSMSRAQLFLMAEENNVGLAAALANLMRDELRPVLEGGAEADIAQFDGAVRSAMAGTRIAKVKVYDPAGMTVYSTDLRQIGVDNADNPGVLGAMEGRRISKLQRRDRFDAYHGLIVDRDLFATYLPVPTRGADGRPIGVFELYADVTDWSRRVNVELAAQLSVLATAFVAIYALLLGAVIVGSRMVGRKHRESVQLAANVARAEAASRTKSEFLANMSHELRTPLNAVIGFAEIMKEGIFGQLSPPIYKEYARDIHASGMHLLGVINDVLELARAESGQTPLSIEEVDIAGAVDEPLRMVRGKAEQAGLALRADVARGLAPLRTDARKLRQIVINLLANAVKFTPKGSVTLRVRDVERGQAVEIAVIDTGIGIAAADIPVCLAPFGQVDSSLSRKHEGSGLGLPLSAKLAEWLGGRLEIESEVGVGTTVRVTLPRRDPAPELRRAA
jgi:signal transduction histidine kinase